MAYPTERFFATREDHNRKTDFQAFDCAPHQSPRIEVGGLLAAQMAAIHNAHEGWRPWFEPPSISVLDIAVLDSTTSGPPSASVVAQVGFNRLPAAAVRRYINAASGCAQLLRGTS